MMSKRLASGCLVLGACLAAAGADAPTSQSEAVTLLGKAVTLAEALRASGLAVDAEPAGSQIVVQREGGSITPLLSDEASRALFQDKRLRDRRIEVRGRQSPGSPYVQVVTFRVEDGGAMRTPEYFCELCRISVRSPQICPCCQGPMDLRMKPEAP